MYDISTEFHGYIPTTKFVLLEQVLSVVHMISQFYIYWQYIFHDIHTEPIPEIILPMFPE